MDGPMRGFDMEDSMMDGIEMESQMGRGFGGIRGRGGRGMGMDGPMRGGMGGPMRGGMGMGMDGPMRGFDMEDSMMDGIEMESQMGRGFGGIRGRGGRGMGMDGPMRGGMGGPMRGGMGMGMDGPMRGFDMEDSMMDGMEMESQMGRGFGGPRGRGGSGRGGGNGNSIPSLIDMDIDKPSGYEESEDIKEEFSGMRADSSNDQRANFMKKHMNQDQGSMASNKPQSLDQLPQSANVKPGDWMCPNPSCANHNFSWRQECKMCPNPS